MGNRWIHLLSVPSQPPPFGETYHAQLLARVKDQLVLHIPTSSGAFANLPNAQGQVELEELYVALFSASIEKAPRTARDLADLNSGLQVRVPAVELVEGDDRTPSFSR